jgi:hypothetical protein
MSTPAIPAYNTPPARVFRSHTRELVQSGPDGPMPIQRFAKRVGRALARRSILEAAGAAILRGLIHKLVRKRPQALEGYPGANGDLN